MMQSGLKKRIKSEKIIAETTQKEKGGFKGLAANCQPFSVVYYSFNF